MRAMYGVDEDEQAPVKALSEKLVPEDRAEFLAAVARSRNHETGGRFEHEHRVTQADGSLRWIHAQAQTWFEGEGTECRAVRVVGVVRDISERKRAELELEQAHTQMLALSRQAGMAEFASGVLHNIGNVLNSVNVASSCVADSLRQSKSANLSKVVALLHEHDADLGAFLTSDPKGKQLPGYLAQLADYLGREQAAVLTELAGLQSNIAHIKDVVTAQQSFAKLSGVSEVLKVSDLIEDSLTMNASALARNDIQVIREFVEMPPITVEKNKVLQILVNLLSNAKHACDTPGQREKRVTLRVTNGNDRVRISVSDNGVGIPSKNLARIFAHGFTTKKDGHGFGLHSSALAAKEMGGSLTVHSDGPGQGAVFTLELPCPPQANSHG
jgi:PAS domain S-box-containing protein